MPNTIPYPDELIIRIFKESKKLAMVGLASAPDRPAHRVSTFAQSHGYTIIPVHPAETEVLGEKAYPDLKAIPFPVDIVDVFRRIEFMPEHVDEAIAIGAKVVWMQENLIDLEAAAKAEAAGLTVIMDRCLHCELNRLIASGDLPDQHA
ncbi:MAG: CoA-binding protein [Chloroflexota bacterium]